MRRSCPSNPLAQSSTHCSNKQAETTSITESPLRSYLGERREGKDEFTLGGGEARPLWYQYRERCESIEGAIEWDSIFYGCCACRVGVICFTEEGCGEQNHSQQFCRCRQCNCNKIFWGRELSTQESIVKSIFNRVPTSPAELSRKRFKCSLNGLCYSKEPLLYWQRAPFD